MIATNLDDLCGTYSLTHFNGTTATAPATLHLAHRKDNVLGYITVANSMRGQLTYDNGNLYGQLMSTMMMGNNDQMVEESAFTNGFAAGLKCKLENNKLMLKNDECSFLFARTVQLEDIHGEHAILSINGEKATEPMSIKFVPDGQGGTFVVANVTNSMRGQCEMEGGYLRGDFACTSLAPTDEMAAAEGQILNCFRTGCTVSRNRNGVNLKAENSYMQLCRIVDAESIAGEYLLRSYNGEAIPDGEQSMIHFFPEEDGSLTVNIKVASQMRGKVRIENNVLRSDTPFKSNRARGTEDHEKIETAYNTGFQYGLLATLLRKNGKVLMLRNSESEFLFTRVATVDAEGDGPTYKGTYANKCFSTNGNGLLFRIVNEHENKWAFYNDTRVYRMFIRATIGHRSDVQPLGDAKMEVESGKFIITATVEPQQTIMFLQGNVNGFQIQYRAEAA